MAVCRMFAKLIRIVKNYKTVNMKQSKPELELRELRQFLIFLMTVFNM